MSNTKSELLKVGRYAGITFGGGVFHAVDAPLVSALNGRYTTSLCGISVKLIAAWDENIHSGSMACKRCIKVTR